MSVDPVVEWLESRLATERRTALGVAIAGAAGGVFALLLTFVFIHGVIFFISLSLFHLPLLVVLFITLALMVALFIGNITTAKEYLESYSFTTGTASDKVVTFYVPTVGVASTINPIAPDSAHSYLKMFVSVLFTGPRLVMGALHNLKRAKRLKRLDVDACGAILSHLLEQEHRVSLMALGEMFPGHDLASLLPQLANVDGVLFLKSEPPGLSLSTDLRREILSSLR